MNHHIITMIFVCLLKIAQGQQHEENGNTNVKHRLLVTLPSSNYFGNKYVERIGFAINSDTISFVSVHPTDDTAYLKETFLHGPFKQKFFFYDFGFEADKIVFKQKYPHIQLPIYPVAKIVNMYEKEDAHKKYIIEGVRLFPDSTIYVYTNGYQTNSIRSHFGFPAKYTGNLKDLETKISRDMASTTLRTPIDSILVYEAVVSYAPSDFEPIRHTNFELRRLIFGKESTFSSIVEKNLSADETSFYKNGKPKWSAAIQGSSGRPMDTKVKIYVRLNADGRTTIKLPRILGNFTGD